MAYNFSAFKNELKRIEEWLGKEYAGIHTGRATPAVLDSISVESYGTRQPISHVASIAPEGPRSLLISPWGKELLKDIERMIQAANLGLTTVATDSGIRVLFPELTTERRTQLVKVLKVKLEEARVSLRQAREKAWNEVQAKEKEGAIPEDEKFRAKEELQKLVDDANKKLEEIAGRKEKEVMS